MPCDIWILFVRNEKQLGWKMTASVVIWLEPRLQLNIGFTFERALTVFTRSDMTPSKVNRLGWNLELWVHSLGLALADFGRDLRSSENWRAKQNFVFFCRISNARFYWFSVGQISRNLNTTRRSVSTWILLEQNCENFPVRGRFSTKTRKFKKNSTSCDFITPQWL